MKLYKKNHFTFYIGKESGNLYSKNNAKRHMPIKYKAYYNHQEPMDLKSYMMITGKNIKDAVKDLTRDGIALIGPKFEICFYDKNGVNTFLESIGAKEKI